MLLFYKMEHIRVLSNLSLILNLKPVTMSLFLAHNIKLLLLVLVVLLLVVLTLALLQVAVGYISLGKLALLTCQLILDNV